MKRQRKRAFRESESQPDRWPRSCKKTASVPVPAKTPTNSLLNINSLPDLPFGALFEWIPLVDLLSAQSVCQQWKEASIREASTHRDSITLCIDGQAEDQKTARYLERSVWTLPHAELLKTDDDKPLYPNYVPPSQRPTWNSLLLATRQENPILLDKTMKTAQKHRKWQANYDRSFATLLDQKVSQLLTLFPRGPRTLTIVCRSQHSDFLRLLPLLTNWKANLVTLKIYSSHPQAFDTEQYASHNRSSHINHHSNRPLLAALNSLSSLRHLTLDLLGEAGDALNDRLFQNQLTEQLWESGERGSPPDFTFLPRLVSFTFADRNFSNLLYTWIRFSTVSCARLSLQALQIGNPILSLDRKFFSNDVRPFSNFISHLHVHPRSPVGSGLALLDVAQDPSPFASLSSLFLNLLHTSDWGLSLFFFLQYLTLNLGLVHLRLHLTGEHVTRWFGEIDSLGEEQRSSLPRLRVLSLILVDNQPIDHRLPSLFQRLFPSLQVIVLHQRLIGPQPRRPTQFLKLFLGSIKRHFSETHFPESSSFLLLEARVFLYQKPNLLEVPEHLWGFGAHLNCLQSKEHTWSAEELRATFIQ